MVSLQGVEGMIFTVCAWCTPKTREQLAILQPAFDDNRSLHHARRAALAQATGLAEKEVDYWFHNQYVAFLHSFI